MEPIAVPDADTGSPSLIVESGQILLFRLFDVADRVDLAAVERQLLSEASSREGVGRLRLQRQRDGVVFTNPPVSARLADRSLLVGSIEFAVRVVARVYDFGAMTILWSLTIPSGTSFDDLSELSVELEGEAMRVDLHHMMGEDAELAVESMHQGLVGPNIHANIA